MIWILLFFALVVLTRFSVIASLLVAVCASLFVSTDQTLWAIIIFVVCYLIK